jgi:hypothetical protein
MSFQCSPFPLPGERVDKTNVTPGKVIVYGVKPNPNDKYRYDVDGEIVKYGIITGSTGTGVNIEHLKRAYNKEDDSYILYKSESDETNKHKIFKRDIRYVSNAISF